MKKKKKDIKTVKLPKEIRTDKLTLRLGSKELEIISNTATELKISRRKLIVDSVTVYKQYIKEMQEKNQHNMFNQ